MEESSDTSCAPAISHHFADPCSESVRDRYLCIVPAQGQLDKAGERIFLPFEGDRTLSLILSKVFLLAADDKITDATILRQLG